MEKYREYSALINGIQVHARYTEENVRDIFLPLLRRLSAMQRKKERRILVMLAAPPGAAKKRPPTERRATAYGGPERAGPEGAAR